jgi:molybdopterin/thiamine biosynthesis adenylyltransferase
VLSNIQIERYSRQIILPQVGGKGQETLLQSRILVNGNSALQTAALFYLAAAGVGTVGVITDTRPSLFSALAPDKQDALSTVLSDLNPDCRITVHDKTELRHFKRVLRKYDILLSSIPDDQLHTACFELNRPFVCAAVTCAGGWLFSSLGYKPDFPCLRCVPLPPFEENLSDATTQDLLPMLMFLGSLQTTEALKIRLEMDLSFAKKLRLCQFSPLYFSEKLVEKKPRCTLCGKPSF